MSKQCSPESDPNNCQQSAKRKAESHNEERPEKRRRSQSPERPVIAGQEVIVISSGLSSISCFIISNAEEYEQVEEYSISDCVVDNLSPEEKMIYQMSSIASAKPGKYETITQGCVHMLPK